jgi:hypothetical protein
MQDNFVDCGVFSCMYARCIGFGQPFSFAQKDICTLRQMMALELASGQMLPVAGPEIANRVTAESSLALAPTQAASLAPAQTAAIPASPAVGGTIQVHVPAQLGSSSTSLDGAACLDESHSEDAHSDLKNALASAKIEPKREDGIDKIVSKAVVVRICGHLSLSPVRCLIQKCGMILSNIHSRDIKIVECRLYTGFKWWAQFLAA